MSGGCREAILVTGASRGLGLAIAKTLLAHPHLHVAITGRDEGRLASARAELQAPPDRLTTLPSDQASRAEVGLLAERLEGLPAPLTGAILNVGVNAVHEEGPRRTHHVTYDVMDATLRTNVTHTLYLVSLLLPPLEACRRGRLVFVGSRAHQVGFPGQIAYNASKSALGGMVRTLNREYGRRGLRADVVHPGVLRTPRVEPYQRRLPPGLVPADPADIAGRIVEIYLRPDRLAEEDCEWTL